MPTASVAIVFVPCTESELASIQAGTPTWIASTPELKQTIASARRLGLPVTELFPNGTSPERWLFNHLDSVDQHHNEFSQTPPYSTLFVFGVQLSENIERLLSEFGFVASSNEAFGFSAQKAQVASDA